MLAIFSVCVLACPYSIQYANYALWFVSSDQMFWRVVIWKKTKSSWLLSFMVCLWEVCGWGGVGAIPCTTEQKRFMLARHNRLVDPWRTGGQQHVMIKTQNFVDFFLHLKRWFVKAAVWPYNESSQLRICCPCLCCLQLSFVFCVLTFFKLS